MLDQYCFYSDPSDSRTENRIGYFLTKCEFPLDYRVMEWTNVSANGDYYVQFNEHNELRYRTSVGVSLVEGTPFVTFNLIPISIGRPNPERDFGTHVKFHVGSKDTDPLANGIPIRIPPAVTAEIGRFLERDQSRIYSPLWFSVPLRKLRDFVYGTGSSPMGYLLTGAERIKTTFAMHCGMTDAFHPFGEEAPPLEGRRSEMHAYVSERRLPYANAEFPSGKNFRYEWEADNAIPHRRRNTFLEGLSAYPDFPVPDFTFHRLSAANSSTLPYEPFAMVPSEPEVTVSEIPDCFRQDCQDVIHYYLNFKPCAE